jgi:CRISPR-associated protein (TIGR02710 family)
LANHNNQGTLNKALIISVGIGPGIEHSIDISIKQHNPELIIFICSERSTETLEREVQGIKIKKFPNSQIVLVDEEDFEKAFDQIKDTVEALMRSGYSSKEIFVDFTAGTKVMSAALVVAAVIYHLEGITYVTGKRDRDGRVLSGSEKVVTINLERVIRLTSFKKDIPAYFNAYQYKASLDIIEGCKNLGELLSKEERKQVEETESLVKGYQQWDRFNHDEALIELNKINQENLKMNIEFLSELIEERKRLSKRVYHLQLKDNLPTPSLLVDLLENARRRVEEGNYDEAVARLYRAIEAAAQLHLVETYHQNPSDFQPQLLKDKLPPDMLKKYEMLKKDKSKVQLGLMDLYKLIHTLEPSNPLASEQILEELKTCLQSRNDSILAHGFKPVKEDAYKKMMELAVKIVKEKVPDLEERMLKCRFLKMQPFIVNSF